MGDVYCNGVGFTAANELLWVESYPRRVVVLGADGLRELCRLPDQQTPDGLAVPDTP